MYFLNKAADRSQFRLYCQKFVKDHWQQAHRAPELKEQGTTIFTDYFLGLIPTTEYLGRDTAREILYEVVERRYASIHAGLIYDPLVP